MGVDLSQLSDAQLAAMQGQLTAQQQGAAGSQPDTSGQYVYGSGAPVAGQAPTQAQVTFANANANYRDPSAPAGSATNPQYAYAGAPANPNAYTVTPGGQLIDPNGKIDLSKYSDQDLERMRQASTPLGAGADMLQSFGTGLRQGVDGLVGAPGAILNGWGQAVDWAAGKLLGSPPSTAAPENYAHDNGLADSSDLATLDQRALGAFHTPQTIGGRYAETAGEIAPWMVGGEATIPAKLAGWGGATLGSQSLAEIAPDNLKPAAHLVGGLVGGAVAGMAGSVANAPSRLVGKALADVTPEQQAQAIALMQASPVDLTLPEAVQQVTGGATGLGRLQHFWENSLVGGERARPFFAERPGQVQQAASDFADTIAPASASPSALGTAMQSSATALLKRAEGYRTQQVDPYYEAANPQLVPAPDMDMLLDKIGGQISADKTGIIAKPLSQLRDMLTDQPVTDEANRQAMQAWQAAQGPGDAGGAAAPSTVTINGQKVAVAQLPPHVQAAIGVQAPAPLDPDDVALNYLRTGRSVPINQGPSLLQYISSNGGLNDAGGELSAMDAQLWHRDPHFGQQAFRSGLIKSTGSSLETMAQRAYDAGYFPDVAQPSWEGSDNTQAVSGQDLLDAIRGELGGSPRYAQTDQAGLDMQSRVDDMAELLNHLGIDPKSGSNADIRAQIDRSFGTSPAAGSPPAAPPGAPPAAPGVAADDGPPAPVRIPITDVENLDRARKYIRDNTAAAMDRGSMTPEQGAVLNQHVGFLTSALENYSPEFAQGKGLYESMSNQYVDPLKAGPIGTIARTDDVGTQTRALYPSNPAEGQAGDTAQAIAMLSRDPSASEPFGGQYPIDLDPATGANLTRAHFVNTADTALSNLQDGPNQWSGARLAKALAGTAGQRATLEAGLDALPGDGVSSQKLGAFLDAMGATGKRQATGSMTAFNQEMRESLGIPPAPVRAATSILDPFEFGAHVDRAIGGALYRRQLRGIGDLVLPAPGQEAAAFAKARAATPKGGMLAQILAAGSAQQDGPN